MDFQRRSCDFMDFIDDYTYNNGIYMGTSVHLIYDKMVESVKKVETVKAVKRGVDSFDVFDILDLFDYKNVHLKE